MNLVKSIIKLSLKNIWTKLFLKNNSIKTDVKKFLLIFPSGIGNTILSNGAIKSLKKKYPTSYFAAGYTYNATLEILKILGGFDEYIFFKMNQTVKERIQLINFLRNKNFDAVVIFYPSCGYIYNCMFLLSGIPYRIGFEYIGDSIDQYSKIFLTHSIKYDYKNSEFQNDLYLLNYFNLELCNSIGFKSNEPCIKDLTSKNLKIGIHVGRNNDLKPGWSQERFSNLIKILQKNQKVDIFVFGGEEEKDISMYFEQEFNNCVFNLIDKLNLAQTISNISKLNLLVSNDTGLMHIAASQNVPLIAIFGPTDSIKNYPIIQEKDNLIVIRKDLSCQPCYSFTTPIVCNRNTECLNLISVKEVLNSVEKMLKRYSKT